MQNREKIVAISQEPLLVIGWRNWRCLNWEFQKSKRKLTPGLEGIEQSTGVDVAGKIIEYLEKNAANGKIRDSASRKADRIQY